MNARTLTPPASQSLPEGSLGDLDAQILRVEQRLIAHEAGLRDGIVAVKNRARAALQPRRLIAPAIGVAAVVVMLGLLWRWRSAAKAPSLTASAFGAAQRRHFSWQQLLGFAGPMLPAPWRAYIGPTSAGKWLTLLLPLAGRLVTRRPEAPLITMQQVDPKLVAGTWFEVARMPPPGKSFTGTAALGRVRTLSCELRGDGTFDAVESATDTTTGAFKGHRRGVARPLPGGGGAKFEVSFLPAAWRWLPLAWHAQWILHIDEAGTEALVGSPNRQTLRVLARGPALSTERLQAMVQVASERGFAVDRLEFNSPP